LNTFAALDQPIRSAVRALIRKDLENGAVPETCLLPLDEVTEHLPMQTQGFSDFYTSLEHCQNCSGEMAAAKIPKNWFYVRPSIFSFLFSALKETQLMIWILLGALSLQLPRLIRTANSQYHPKTLERLFLQRDRFRAYIWPH
jgi:hypothetical protein